MMTKIHIDCEGGRAFWSVAQAVAIWEVETGFSSEYVSFSFLADLIITDSAMTLLSICPGQACLSLIRSTEVSVVTNGKLRNLESLAEKIQTVRSSSLSKSNLSTT